jgi:hypothetical protein
MSYNYDFELSFIGNYDSNVISNASIPDKDSTFQNSVEEKINSILNIFSIYTGVNTMSCLLEYNQTKYKITLTRS